MSFPCLICGDLPLVSVQQPHSSPHPTSTLAGRGGSSTGGSNSLPRKIPASGSGGGSNGTTIRTLSKDVSDKIFQNLCRHLYIKTEPYWFIQNPGEQMPLCGICSGTVLEIFTLQSKIEQFQTQIKKHVWKVERMVADTEIACNWMATREEQEVEENIWNSLPCPPTAIRIARERHYKFRQQILQNFKRKVKLRQRMRATGQQNYELLDLENEPSLNAHMSEAELAFSSNANANRAEEDQHCRPLPPLKRPRLDNNFPQSFGTSGQQQGPIIVSSSSRPNSAGVPLTMSSRQNQNHPNEHPVERQSPSTVTVKIPSTISITAARVPNQEFVDESEYSDSDNNSQVYPDVQIVCSAGPLDFLKEEMEHDQSNSGDGDESTMEQDSLWSLLDGDNVEGDEPMSVSEGEEVVWLAPEISMRKSFIDKLLQENLKPSVFLRKLTFASFGLKQLANSSGISGSSKPGSKPSLDRYRFEALREYTVDTYGIRENINELDDLNRKIRTVCCDARKALKRRLQKPPTQMTSNTPSSSLSGLREAVHITPLPDAFHISDNLSKGEKEDEDIIDDGEDNDDDDHSAVQPQHHPESEDTLENINENN